jgi:hypothetical protein
VVYRGEKPNENEKTTALTVVCFVEKCPRKGSNVPTKTLGCNTAHGHAHGTQKLSLRRSPRHGGRCPGLLTCRQFELCVKKNRPMCRFAGACLPPLGGEP